MPFFHKSENFLRPELIYPDIFISYSLIGKVHFLIKRKERRNTVSELGRQRGRETDKEDGRTEKVKNAISFPVNTNGHRFNLSVYLSIYHLSGYFI